MKRYLLDTNICIYFLKGQFDLYQKIEVIGEENCFISEITIAELKYGVEKSNQVEKNRATLEKFQNKFTILPIFTALDVYAKEKARLKTKGKMLDDFDLLIGATAISNSLTLATRNVNDFDRLKGIKIEDWTSLEKKKSR
ncbi:MAG TPA: type II toxin-antitoxin system VapC family toxin [Chitinophagaceae bacterium]